MIFCAYDVNYYTGDKNWGYWLYWRPLLLFTDTPYDMTFPIYNTTFKDTMLSSYVSRVSIPALLCTVIPIAVLFYNAVFFTSLTIPASQPSLPEYKGRVFLYYILVMRLSHHSNHTYYFIDISCFNSYNCYNLYNKYLHIIYIHAKADYVY